MKPRLFILMLLMELVVIALCLPALAEEGAGAGHTQAEHTLRDTPKHQAEAGKLAEEQPEPETHGEHTGRDEPAIAEEHGKRDESGEQTEAGHANKPGGHDKPGKHAEAGHAGKQGGHGESGEHKEYPKLAEGINKIAYLAIGFITFVLIAVPIGAHLEKKKHPHASPH